MKPTSADSPFGRPYDPDALIRGLIRGVASDASNAINSVPIDGVISSLHEHISALAASARAGKKPTTVPKIRLQVLICGWSDPSAVIDAVRRYLRDTGPHLCVSFAPEFAGIAAGRDLPPGFLRGVDGSVEMTPGNLRSWKNRLKPAHLIIGDTTHHPLVNALTLLDSAGIFSVVDAPSLVACASLYERYRVDRVGGRIFITCAGKKAPAPVGTAIYDDLAAI